MLLMAAMAGPAASAEVIVNAAQPQASISRAFLRGMFGMRLRAWPDGTPVRVYVLGDDDPLHVEFSTEVLQTYPYQLRQNWDRLVYSGTGQPPIQVGSAEDLLRRVAETPGAIGYAGGVRPAALSGKVKVLNVR
ncbi:MAG: hypothetical protein HYV18_07770 [Gammaproteobacteria bacterium]|nr:hypothetical protein [Gammaproteobacteria bacterium]